MGLINLPPKKIVQICHFIIVRKKMFVCLGKKGVCASVFVFSFCSKSVLGELGGGVERLNHGASEMNWTKATLRGEGGGGYLLFHNPVFDTRTTDENDFRQFVWRNVLLPFRCGFLSPN